MRGPPRPLAPCPLPLHLKPGPVSTLCTGVGKDSPDGPCTAGYYCPPGQTSATPPSFRCPQGFYCPEGSSQPRACENGTFQPQEAKGSCEPCPAGFYCAASGTGRLAENKAPTGAGSPGPEAGQGQGGHIRVSWDELLSNPLPQQCPRQQDEGRDAGAEIWGPGVWLAVAQQSPEGMRYMLHTRRPRPPYCPSREA